MVQRAFLKDPEIRITELEDPRVRLEVMGSCISDNQFIIYTLNNLTSDYELQWKEDLGMMKSLLRLKKSEGS